MRIYLLAGLALSVALPMLSLPGSWYQFLPGPISVDIPLNLEFLNVSPDLASGQSGDIAMESKQWNLGGLLSFLIMGIYIIGVVFSLYRLTKKLWWIRNSIRQHPREKRDGFCLIRLESQAPACSFLNYIFLNKNLNELSSSEVDRIIQHEAIHVRQRHTLDILFAELVLVLFWFNPLMKIYRTYLTEVHEYLADENTLIQPEMKKPYSNLLLKLTTEGPAMNLSSGFSARLISRRIMMMDRVRSLPRQKFMFFLLVPAAVLLLMSFSYFENRSSVVFTIQEEQNGEIGDSTQLRVGQISWEGNTLFTDSQLTKELRIKPGDAYSEDHLLDRLYRDADAVNTLFLDKGYIFLQLDFEEEPKADGTMDLTVTIYEGTISRIGQIIITGNGSVPRQDVLEVILLKQGDLFSKTKLIQSVQAIEQLNKFVPEEIRPNPIPLQDPVSGEYSVVDIEFVLMEK